MRRGAENVAGLPLLDDMRMIDTLDLSRKRFPGAKHSLDALCTRFGIDRSARVVHGALIDAQLLADVSEWMTLNAGDVLLVGVRYQAPQAKAGSAVRLSAEGLGSLNFTIAQGVAA